MPKKPHGQSGLGESHEFGVDKSISICNDRVHRAFLQAT
jgi:hypothetical protein